MGKNQEMNREKRNRWMDGWIAKEKCSKNRNFGEIIILCVIVYNDNNISHGTIELCDSHARKTMNARTHTLSLSMLPSPLLPKDPYSKYGYLYHHHSSHDAVTTTITITIPITNSSNPCACCPSPRPTTPAYPTCSPPSETFK